jgi:YHS domain-containing protein
MKRLGTEPVAALCFVLGCIFPAEVAMAAEPVGGDPYPLDKCIVSGNKLGSMGEPVTIDYKGREIRFCCADCKPKFEAKPAEYIRKIDAAIIERQKSYYPLDTCVISGKTLGAGAVDRVIGNRLVRFCCPDCVAAFKKDPAKYFSRIDEAARAKAKS